MPLEKYQIKEEFPAEKFSKLDICLGVYLFCTSVVGSVLGSLWALGYVEIWMPPQW